MYVPTNNVIASHPGWYRWLMAKPSFPSMSPHSSLFPFSPQRPFSLGVSSGTTLSGLCMKDEPEERQRVAVMGRKRRIERQKWKNGTKGEKRGGEGCASGGASRGLVCPWSLQLSRIRHLFFSSLSLSLFSSPSFSLYLDMETDRHARTVKLPARVGPRISCATRGTARNGAVPHGRSTFLRCVVG